VARIPRRRRRWLLLCWALVGGAAGILLALMVVRTAVFKVGHMSSLGFEVRILGVSVYQTTFVATNEDYQAGPQARPILHWKWRGGLAAAFALAGAGVGLAVGRAGRGRSRSPHWTRGRRSAFERPSAPVRPLTAE
jgi:hypothetical protein